MYSRKKIIIFLVICIVIGLGIGIASARLKSRNIPSSQSILPEPVKPIVDNSPKTVRLMFVGDIMMARGVQTSITKNFGGDYNKMFANVGIFHDADIVFGNLEGDVSDVGNNVGSIYSFRMDPAVIPALKSAGFNAVSFANNHVGDYNVAAFTDTLDRLDNAGIAHVGAGQNISEASKAQIIEKNGIRVGFIGCSDVGPNWIAATKTNPGIILCSDPNLGQYISQAKSESDFLVFSAHWGDEYLPRTSREQTLAHLAIDAGADLVIGAHPHVIQATEMYDGKMINYSMGNFIFDQSFSKYVEVGKLLDITIGKNGVESTKQEQVSINPTTHQPGDIKDLLSTNVVTDKSQQAAPFSCQKPTDPKEKNLSLDPVGPDLSIGTYVPPDLVELDKYVPTSATTICLDSPAATALQKMVSAMHTAKLYPIVASGFRDMNYQEGLQPTNVVTNGYSSVALPGHSEHQLGVAVDLVDTSKGSASDPQNGTINDFGTTPSYAWMLANAASYGFVQSYQVGKEAITGYIAEDWHWRYVGVPLAQTIVSSGLSPYEYLKANPQ